MMNSLKISAKLSYGGADFGFNLLFGSTAAFLLYFYTDVFGLSAGEAGIVLLAARLWDAVFDLTLGAMVDRTRTRFGQMRPYLFLGAPLAALAAVACFTVPNLAGGAKLAYAFVSYAVLMTAYSIVNIPYGALPTLMTADSQARTVLASWRMFFAFAGMLVMGAATQPLVGILSPGDPASGYQRVMAIFGVVLVMLVWACAATCRERVAPLPDAPRESLWRDVTALFRDRAFVCLGMSNLIAFSILLMPMMNAVYYMTYVVGLPAMIPAYMVTSSLGMMAAAVLSARLTRTYCKRSVWRFSSVLGTVALASVYLIDVHSLPQVLLMAAVTSLAIGIAAPISFAMASDVADALELSHGRRLTGLVFSTVAFSGKAGMGLGGAIGGLLLGWFGYVPNVSQTPGALQGIWLCMSLIPAGGCLLLLVFQWLYPLGRQQIEAISRELEVRRLSGSCV